jgi:hypothetical protein
VVAHDWLVPDLCDDVAEMTRYLTEASDAISSWFPDVEWVPAWQSEAARELTETVRGAGGPWGDMPVRTAYAAAAFLLEAVLQCVRALSGALTAEATPYVANCLARSALEAGSRAWWLLEPDIGAQRRVARFLLIRARSARAVHDTAKTLGAEPGDYGETVATVFQHAAALGFELVSTDQGRRWSCGVDKLPSCTARARAFEQALRAGGSYAIYSGSAHAAWHAIISGWQLPQIPGDVQSLLVNAPDRVAMWSAVFNTVSAGLEVSRRALDLLGHRARLLNLYYLSGNALALMRRMELRRDWWSDTP